MNTNNTQRLLIKTLTATHPNAAEAYRQAARDAKTPEQAEQIQRIGAALGIEDATSYNIATNNGRKLKITFDKPNKKIIFTALDDKGNPERRETLDAGEAVLIYDFIICSRDRNGGKIEF